jgi:NADH-quinone oxidoreductase subunit N
MILSVFLVICVVGVVAASALRTQARLGAVTGIVFLAAALAAALALGSGEPVTIGDVQLSVTAYASAFLVVGLGAATLLSLVGLTTGAAPRMTIAALATFGGLGIALTSMDPRVSMMAGTASAATGAVALVHLPSSGRRDGRLDEVRTLALVAGALLFAAAAALRPVWSGGDGRALGLAYLGLALAIAVRGGAIPFHIPAAHLARNAISMAPALLLVWIPSGLAALALTWSPLAFHVESDWVSAGIAAIQIVAVATIVLGALAALVHDELEEVTGYSIISDAGFILLALAARSEDAAEPARLWLLVFVAAKTALVVWAGATARAFGSSHLGRLRGWLRRTPLLGLCLVAIAVASLGWPGSEVARVRGDLVRLGLPGELGFLTALVTLLSILYYARLLLIGVLAPTETVRQSRGERPRFGFAAARARSGSGAAAAEVPAAVPAEAAAAPAEAAASAVAAAPADLAEETKPKRKRRTRAAAAQETAPTVSAEVPIAETSTEPAPGGKGASGGGGGSGGEAAAPASGSGGEVKDLVLPKPKRPRGSLRHRAAVVWRLNRTLEVSLVVVAAAVLSLVVAAGSFGASNAAEAGLPLGTAAHATPTATPMPSLPPTQAPLPTGTLQPTPGPEASGGVEPTGSPGASAAPVKTAGQPTPVIR